MAEARSLMARTEHVLRPSEEADLPKILARRLFERVDAKAARPVAEAYADGDRDGRRARHRPARRTCATALGRRGRGVVPVPSRRSSACSTSGSRRSRTSSARAARCGCSPASSRSLWEQQPDDADLIRLDHVDLAERDIAEDLSSRLDRATFEPVIRADVCSQAGGEPSHCRAGRPADGRRYARRLAIAAYLLLAHPGRARCHGRRADRLDPRARRRPERDREGARQPRAKRLVPARRRARLPLLDRDHLIKLVEDATREVTVQKTKQRATADPRRAVQGRRRSRSGGPGRTRRSPTAPTTPGS